MTSTHNALVARLDEIGLERRAASEKSKVDAARATALSLARRDGLDAEHRELISATEPLFETYREAMLALARTAHAGSGGDPSIAMWLHVTREYTAQLRSLRDVE